mmetsp:Transcript_13457/g.20182  ORF Transcript_13457/g.20182 Transcript_13457/m.20182 type:complete len:606 (-) Transcript_13457:144-1961(-)
MDGVKTKDKKVEEKESNEDKKDVKKLFTPKPPKGRPPHIVRAFRFLEIDTKGIEALVDLSHLGESLKLQKKAILGLLPLLESKVDPKPFIDSINDAVKRYEELERKKKMKESRGLFKRSKSQEEKEREEKMKAAKKRLGGMDLSPERLRLELTILHNSLQTMGYYDARVRRFIRDLCKVTGVPWDLFCRYEDLYCHALRETVKAMEDAKEKRAQNWKWRWAKIGGVAVVGGALTALTAGLAAPLVGAGLVAVGGGSVIAGTGAFIATSGGALFFGAMFGGYATQMLAYKVDKRIADVKEFEFMPLSEKANPENKEDGSMAVILCIGGWHLDDTKAEEEIRDVWQKRAIPFFMPDKEVYGLKWESKEQMEFGNALSNFATKELKAFAIEKGVVYAGLAAVTAPLTWPLLILQASEGIDNSYSVAINRTDKAALLLADAIEHRIQGNRPVTIVAYSLGARLVFKALEAIAKWRKERAEAEKLKNEAKDVKMQEGKKDSKSTLFDSGKNDPQAMIMDIVLIGAGVTADNETWRTVRSVVAGRLVNAYSSMDWILRLLVRSNEMSYSLAGIQPIDVDGVENVDVGDIAQSHFDYDKAIPDILERIRFYP